LFSCWYQRFSGHLVCTSINILLDVIERSNASFDQTGRWSNPAQYRPPREQVAIRGGISPDTLVLRAIYYS